MNLNKIIAVRTSKTVYRDEDKAIKVFDTNYSKADVLNEALNHVRAEETGLSIPKLIEVTTINGKWAIVFEFVEGKTLQRLMEEDPGKFDEYLHLFVDTQLEIHKKKAPLLIRMKDKMNRKIAESNIDATTRYDLHTRLENMPKHSKVCHGDYNPGNIIIDKEGKPYILDWSHVTQGNASADAARTYMLFWLSGDIVSADQYVNLFCEKSDTSKRYIKRWLPIVAAAQSIKVKPDEKEVLMRWANTMDYQS